MLPSLAAGLLSGPRLWLLVYAAIMLLSMLPAWYRARRDARRVRDVGVWTKPLKFMAALAVFAATTALLMLAVPTGADPDAEATLARIALLLIGTGTFEIAYITLQASRAEESHYNISTPFYLVMNILMALGAIGLTASQLWLALAIMRLDGAWLSSLVTVGVVSGLLLTFALTIVTGFMLGARRAPPGQGMAVVGWHRHADFRPAHFLGVHAQQAIPLFGCLAAVLAALLAPPAGWALFVVLTVAYLLAFAWAVRLEWQAPAQVLAAAA